MPPAIVAAGIGAAAGIGGAVLSSSAQKKAASKAAGAAEQNSAANNAMTREIYGSNKALLSPFANNGLQASNALNAMLLGQPTQAQAPQAQGTQQYGQAVPVGESINFDEGFGGLNRFIRSRMEGGRPAIQPPTTSPPIVAGGSPAVNPWDQYRNSTNYQFRLNEGNKGLNQMWAANGALESGAAGKAFIDYNQNFAANELGNYQQLLAGQQNMGLGAASAVAGVGQNMVNNVTANNNSAAQVAAQAALQRGAANANMFSSIAGSLGGLFGSSYGR